MKIWLKKVFKKIKHRVDGTANQSSLITIFLSKSALLHNLKEFRRLAPHIEVAPVLKSNAYGHGLIPMAHALEKEHVPFLIIDSYFEAENLRNEGIKIPLLIIGYVRSENINQAALKNVSYVVSSLDTLHRIKSSTKIHLKIDTGMHRQGIMPEEKDQAVKMIKSNSNIILEGICSHFSDADNNNPSFTETQIDTWNILVDYFRNHFPSLVFWHISNTAGHAYIKKAETNLTRLGLGLYGINQGGQIDSIVNLQPVLEMKTIITSIKKIKKGDCVGYGCTFIAPHDMTIATIPVGYYEGLDRRLSNKGLVKIENVFCLIIGRVSMNITTIDVSKVDQIKVGDEVIVMSSVKQDKNSIESISKDCNTIPYEIAVHIPSQLKRVVVY